MARAYQARLLLMGLAVLLCVVVVSAVAIGPVPIAFSHSLGVIGQSLGLGHFADYSEQEQTIIHVLRLPRVLLGVLIGSTLGVSGAAMQGLFRNPLADPSIIGVSAGAALGAAFAMVFVGWLAGYVPAGLAHYSVAIFAFLGGLVTTFVIYKMGSTSRGVSVATMLLAGIAISALVSAALGFMVYMADDNTLRNLMFWQMGSLAQATWSEVWVCTFALLPQMGLLYLAKPLNVLLLGESEAAYLGVNVTRLKTQLIVLVALGVGIAVGFSGIIGFVGLVVPHVIRLLVGPDHRYVLPASCLLGASLLVISDTIARTVLSPAELPIGMITALLGAPFFLYLLIRQRPSLS